MATPAVSFGCAIGQIAPGHIAEFAQRAESLGFDRLVTGEHIQDGTPPIPRLLALPVLAAAAAATKRIRVMSGIVIAPLYHPVMLAQLVAASTSASASVASAAPESSTTSLTCR